MTGASGKLGSEIALSVAGQGYTIFFTWHHAEERALELLERIRWVSPESEMVRCDVSKTADIIAAFREFSSKFDRLDLLVASASNFYQTPLPEVSEEQWDSLMDTNLKGAFFTMQEAARIMQKQSFTSRIITMTDISTRMAWTGFAPYTAAKTALAHLTKVFARRFAPTILVNSIAPGTVAPAPGREEPETAQLVEQIPLGRAADPIDIVKAVIFLLEHDYMTGQVLDIDGGRLLQ